MIKKYLYRLYSHWRVLMKDKAYSISLLIGFLVLFGALFINFKVSAYNDLNDYSSVGDLILDSIPTYDLGFLYDWGFIGVIVAICVYGLLYKPEKAPFILKTFGILLLVRSCFILLTHIGPPIGFLVGVEEDSMGTMFFKNDLFFSGHTSVPFMCFLLTGDGKIFKWVMLVASFVLGATVLLMHIHYSIDVFAAYFITYGIFALSNKIFNYLNVRFKNRINFLYYGKS